MNLKKSNYSWSWKLYFKGCAMGIADIIPGVSGGTIALLLGIYNQFISSLSQLHPRMLKELIKGKVHPALKFIINLALGMASAIILGAKVIHYALEHCPQIIWGLFFSLIMSSLIILVRKEKTNLISWFFFIIGACVAFGITRLTPSQLDPNPLFIFISGAIAITAMMLPGISGSFILLVLGLYQFIISAIKSPFSTESLKVILVFGLGAITGLLVGSRALKKLLEIYRHQTLMLLLGFMLGAAPKLWPWQKIQFHGSAWDFFIIFIMLISFIGVLWGSKTSALKESSSHNNI